ncbi:unnamed protein product, partial [marine sediment metagenome]
DILNEKHAEGLGVCDHVNIPTSSPKNRIKLKKKGVVYIKKVDNVLSRVILPSGWSIICTRMNPCYRTLIDEESTKIANIYLKHNERIYKGSIDIFEC